MFMILKFIRHWIPGYTRAQHRHLARLQTAANNSLAAGDPVLAEQGCSAVAKYLQTVEDDGVVPAVKRLLGCGYFNLGSNYRLMMRVDEAEAAYCRAIEWLTELERFPWHKRFARTQRAACMNHLGMLYTDCGAPEKALSALETAIAMRRALLQEQPDDKENHMYLGGALCNRANLASQAEEFQSACAYYDESLTVLAEAVPPCECGCRDAILAAMAQATHVPDWLMLAEQFRMNATRGREYALSCLPN